MSNIYLVGGRVQYGVQAYIQAASEEEAIRDFLVLVEMAVHDGLRPDDVVADFDWSDVTVIDPSATVAADEGDGHGDDEQEGDEQADADPDGLSGHQVAK